MKKGTIVSGYWFQNKGLGKQELCLSWSFSARVDVSVYPVFLYASSSVWAYLLIVSAFFLPKSLFGKKTKKMPIHALAKILAIPRIRAVEKWTGGVQIFRANVFG